MTYNIPLSRQQIPEKYSTPSTGTKCKNITSFTHTFHAKIKQGRLQKGGASTANPKKEHYHGEAVCLVQRHGYGINSQPLAATSLQWVGWGCWRRIWFYIVNWSRNELISKSIDYILVFYTTSQLDRPKTIISRSPMLPVGRASCLISFPLSQRVFGWLLRFYLCFAGPPEAMCIFVPDFFCRSICDNVW